MRPYLAIVSARFRVLLQYRAAALAGVWTQVFFGFVLIMVYEGFYRSTDAPPPLPFPRLASYVWLGQALLATFPWNADPELRAAIAEAASEWLSRPSLNAAERARDPRGAGARTSRTGRESPHSSASSRRRP